MWRLPRALGLTLRHVVQHRWPGELGQPLAAAALSTNAGGQDIFDSVVKISSTSLQPNYHQPWQLKGQSESSGSGFAISDGLILTNAHVVADSVFTTAKRRGGSERFKARVHAIAHECDLALLAVEEPRFWGEPAPLRQLELGGIPQLQDEVIVVGYPTGGSNMSITQGVVSRVGMTPYAHTGTNLLAVQIDAAINSGNSGGPALKDGKVVGVAFQDLEDAQNIAYVIPVPVIAHFLAEVEREGAYRGTSCLGVRCQTLESPAARRALGLSEDQTGVLVVSVLPQGPAAGCLRAGDVLLSFDGTPIANDGTILFRPRERISFEHLVSLKVPGDAAALRVLRDGRELELAAQLRPLQPPVPAHQHERRPSYYIYGGLVFMPLTQPYLQEWGEEGGDDWQSKCPQNLHQLALNFEAQEPGQQVVILSQVLAHDVNWGYGRKDNLQLLEVDGVRVRNMAHLVELLEGRGSCGGSGGGDDSCSSSSSSNDGEAGQPPGGRRFVRFTLEKNQVVILDRQAAEAAEEAILETHHVPARCSRDLRRGPAAPGPPAAAAA